MSHSWYTIDKDETGNISICYKINLCVQGFSKFIFCLGFTTTAWKGLVIVCKYWTALLLPCCYRNFLFYCCYSSQQHHLHLQMKICVKKNTTQNLSHALYTRNHYCCDRILKPYFVLSSIFQKSISTVLGNIITCWAWSEDLGAHPTFPYTLHI